jgi:hypothetical protein
MMTTGQGLLRTAFPNPGYFGMWEAAQKLHGNASL